MRVIRRLVEEEHPRLHFVGVSSAVPTLEQGSKNSMAQQTNIKSVIEVLCSFCKKLGFSKITPEIFRQAKHDSNEACKPFWILLYELLWYGTHKKIKGSKTIQDTIAFVQAVFYDLGYRSKEFFYSSPLSSSRVLLIAFGWLVGKYQIIDLLIDNAENCFLDHMLGKCKEEISPNDRDASLNLSDSLDYLLVCYNRGGMEWKNLRQLFKFIVRKAAKSDCQIETECRSIQLFFDNATVVDILTIVDNARNQEQNILVLEKHLKLLNLYIKWVKNEDTFWKWMASVVHNDRRQKSGMEEIGTVRNNGVFIKETKEHTHSKQQDGLSDVLSGGIFKLSDLVSKLIQVLLMVNWVKQDCKHAHQVPYSYTASPSFGGDDIQKLIDYVCSFITEIEQKQKLLDDDIQKHLTLENNASMEDIVHLPLPRK